MSSIDVVSVTKFWDTVAFLVARIVSCSVSKIPFAWYVTLAAVFGRVTWSFVELDVNLNSTSPVLNLGIFSWPLNLYSGILNDPLTLPVEFVISWEPSTTVDAFVNSVDEGVTKFATAVPSKKG